MYTVDPEREERMDVMLAVGDTTDAGHAREEDPWPDARHFHEYVHLVRDVWIGPLTNLHSAARLSEAVLDAVEPQGLNCRATSRLYFSRYALLRRNAPEGPARRSVDPDNELGRVAQILRLVRPHGMSAGHMARIITQPDGRCEICPKNPYGPGSAAFVMEPTDRWVRDEDIERVRPLLERIPPEHAPEPLPKRITKAMLAHELIDWQNLVEVRWLLLITALEGLVHTDDRSQATEMQSREQFVVRLRRLVEFVPELTWTEHQLTEVYAHRNQTMHGGSVSALWATEPFPPLYRLAEEGLRTILRAAILNPELVDVFARDDGIRSTLGCANRPR